MIKSKLKMCAGCNTEQHIYKNIDGKKYCKSCTFKLEPPKQKKSVFKIKVKRISEQELIERRDLRKKDNEFYLEIWNKRFQVKVQIGDTKSNYLIPKCEVCQRFLWGEPNLMYFHHILEKRNFPQYRHIESNIAIVCPDCHNRYETYPDKVPYLVEKRKELLSLHYENKLV
jgi:hypothetical protein